MKSITSYPWLLKEVVTKYMRKSNQSIPLNPMLTDDLSEAISPWHSYRMKLSEYPHPDEAPSDKYQSIFTVIFHFFEQLAHKQ